MSLYFIFDAAPTATRHHPHVKMLSIVAPSSWWQWSRCLWWSTKADFDIWDDKETHALRSTDRQLILSAQTWCRSGAQYSPVDLGPNPTRPSSHAPLCPSLPLHCTWAWAHTILHSVKTTHFFKGGGALHIFKNELYSHEFGVNHRIIQVLRTENSAFCSGLVWLIVFAVYFHVPSHGSILQVIVAFRHLKE